jgi:hypothetical protein
MSALPEPDLSRAVLIGTSHFEHLPALPAVRNNLTELSRSLTDPDSGILTAQNCSIVDSLDSTSRFVRRLSDVARQAEDFLLVYYSGHGLRHETRDLLYLAVQDTDRDLPEGTAVRFDSVREIIENSPARTKLLILDCCYSGLALGVMSGGTIESRDVQVGGTAVITSSPSNRTSHSPPGDQFTAFTGEFISLLRNGSRIPGEPLTVDTAFRSLQAALARRHLPEPKRKVTDTGGDVLLRRPTRPAPEPPPKPRPRPEPVPRPELRVVPRARPVPRLPNPRTTPPRPSPASELPTVPSMQPVAPSPPEPAQRARGIATKVVQRLMADSGWLLLWVVMTLGTGYGVGGTFAVLVEPSTDVHFGTDLSASIGGGVFGLLSLGVIILRVRWLRRQGRPSPSITARMRTPVLAVTLGACAFLVLIGILTGTTGADSAPTSEPPSLSNLALTAMITYLGLLGTGICGVEFHRHRRPLGESVDGRGTPPALP